MRIPHKGDKLLDIMKSIYLSDIIGEDAIDQQWEDSEVDPVHLQQIKKKVEKYENECIEALLGIDSQVCIGLEEKEEGIFFLISCNLNFYRQKRIRLALF